jgi:pSer/pThr/pTyr-binding forkhead associated (FHA) protein
MHLLIGSKGNIVATFDLLTPDYSRLEYLRDYHTFGRRSGTVDTVLNYPYISKLHAIVEWCEPNWLLRDVSTNGIKLNHKIISIQKPMILNVGDTVDFGANEVSFKIKDLSPPTSLLINQSTPNEVIEMSQSVLLPNEGTPEFFLYFCLDRKHWFVEDLIQGQEIGPYEHNDIIQMNQKQWRFFLIAQDDATAEIYINQASLEDVIFRFDLSQDEESANLTLITDGSTLELGERSHHYLLVHLLRYRILNDYQAGWLDNHLLMKELGLEETHLNIQIFRARKQVATALPNMTGHSKFIERRRGALRLGIRNFEIYKEGIQEIAQSI